MLGLFVRDIYLWIKRQNIIENSFDLLNRIKKVFGYLNGRKRG